MPNLSERNGDKSRFGRQRRQKILRRKKNREFQKALGLKKSPAATDAKTAD
jgi:hypothetical protein